MSVLVLHKLKREERTVAAAMAVDVTVRGWMDRQEQALERRFASGPMVAGYVS